MSDYEYYRRRRRQERKPVNPVWENIKDYWALAAVALVVVFVIWTIMISVQNQRACNDKGGVYIKGAWGYQCAFTPAQTTSGFGDA